MSKKVTVVTVCYQSEDTIEMTIESVLSQNYYNFEYIIVDGASSDNTWKYIEKHLEDKRIVAISESDNGLYDAMNKATDMASGDYLIFMNSGDVFVDNNVIANMASHLMGDIVYGNVIRIRTDGEKKETYGGRGYVKWLLLQGRMICHQAMFIKTSTMRQYRYDLEYRITADFNFLCKCVRDKLEFTYIDIDVSKMDNVSGISTEKKNLPIMWKEDDRSIKDCFPLCYQMLRPVKWIKRRLD